MHRLFTLTYSFYICLKIFFVIYLLIFTFSFSYIGTYVFKGVSNIVFIQFIKDFFLLHFIPALNCKFYFFTAYCVHL